ncbi:MAG: dockerin type I repeat-containing protein [Ruminococcus sp.]|nr:dockerin type I repeat-containing protein [Ruminococcus sp.]
MKKASIRIIAFAVALVLMMSVCAMGSAQAVIDFEAMIKDGEIYDVMYKYLSPYFYEEEPAFGVFVAYEHFDNNGLEPDYIIVEVFSTATVTKVNFEVDEYYIYCYNPVYLESPLTYYVIDYKTNDVTPLIDAVNASKDEYYQFFTDSGYEKITRIGDLNGDNNLDIKDATLIQKCLAGVEEFDAYNDMVLGFLEKHHGKWERYISDFNRDGVRNVKDATAIQKYIAGLEY